MEKLPKEFIEKQKAFLLKEKERLEKESTGLEQFPQYGDSTDDNTEEVEDFGNSQGQEEGLLLMLEDTKKALFKIEHGRYGYCENCGKMIDIKRLEAFPAATTCIKCDEVK